MNKSEKNANALRNVKKNGIFAKLLNKQSIDYDKIDQMLLRTPELIKMIRCTIKDNKLAYEVPEGLHRDVQALNFRAICIICYALPKNQMEVVCNSLSRRKKTYLKSAWTRFHQAS